MNPTLLALTAIGALLALAVPAHSRPDTWSLPLSEKERAIEANIQARHNIMGLYPSQVEVPQDGRPVDNSTLGIGNIAHAVCWTANYLAGTSYRYAFLKREGAAAEEVAAAKARTDEIFEAVYRCQLVTGVRGLQARGYALGHGESYEERWGDGHSEDWHQGAGEYRDLRWRGSPSHHNYSDSIHGLGAYYDLAAEGPQKERCREAIDALVGYWVDNDLKIQPLDPEKPAVPILGFTDGRTPNTRIIMAIAGAKVAHHATGKPKYKECHDRLVEQYGLRGRDSFSQGESRRHGHDDAEHVFGHLDNLFRIEDDPELVAYYRVVADALWANHKDDAQSLFTYIYLGSNPECPDREKGLADALGSLRTWPTDTTLFPVMNSLRGEVEQAGGGLSKEPLPLNEAAWDNEYIWKGHLYRLDGWHSRPIVSVSVSAEDEYVMYACDAAGDIYQTRDNAESWRCISDDVPAPARHLCALGPVRMVAAATDGGLYLTTTGGYTWQQCPLPGNSGTPREVKVDPGNRLVLYVTTDRGIYRSKDFGPEHLGEEWECLSSGLPRNADVTYAIGISEAETLVYALLDGVIYTKTPGAADWTRGATLGPLEHVDPYPWLVVDPSNPRVAYTGFRTDFMGGVRSLLSKTTDGGATWTVDVGSLTRAYAEGNLMAILARLVEGEFFSFTVDPRESGTLYAGTQKGLMRSADGGDTWQAHSSGLDIPWVTNVMAPAHTSLVLVGTLAGLYQSADGGESFTYANLRCQFEKNTVREIGGAAHIDAYWLGRYHGFIDQETADAPPGEWE